jgi:hypothetical protein
MDLGDEVILTGNEYVQGVSLREVSALLAKNQGEEFTSKVVRASCGPEKFHVGIKIERSSRIFRRRLLYLNDGTRPSEYIFYKILMSVCSVRDGQKVSASLSRVRRDRRPPVHGRHRRHPDAGARGTNAQKHPPERQGGTGTDAQR